MADYDPGTELHWLACPPCIGLRPPQRGCPLCEGRGEYRGQRSSPLPQAADSTPLTPAEKERGLAWAKVLREGHAR